MSTKDARRHQIALYRFQVIAPLLPPQLTPAERAVRIEQILRGPPLPVGGQPPPELSARTIYRWLKAYRTAGEDPLRALEPRPRRDRRRSRTVAPELLAQVIGRREKAPGLSVREILKRLDHPDAGRVPLRNVGRALKDAGYDRRDKRRRRAERKAGRGHEVDWDLLRFEADFPNDLWQADSTPGIWLARGRYRERPVQLQIVNIIDDHSRLLVGGGFTERLRVIDFLAFLLPAFREYGCPTLFFLDQAKVHRSTIVVEGLARLGGTAVFGTVGHAPGHGKVERLHQNQQDTLIEDLRLSPVETVEEANLRYRVWRERYVQEVHGETGEAPLSRWQRIVGNARIPGEEQLRWAFRGSREATVDEVGAIRCLGQVYEVPSAYRKNERFRVTVRFDLLDRSQVWIEEEDGRLACPLYRVRSHHERRQRYGRHELPGISFSSLFGEGEGAGE